MATAPLDRLAQVIAPVVPKSQLFHAVMGGALGLVASFVLAAR